MRPQPATDAFADLEQQHADLSVQLESFSSQLFDLEHRATAAESLLDLLLNIGMHFGCEEAAMVEMKYPEHEHHRRQHMSLMTELGLLLDRIQDTTDLHAVARDVDLLTSWYRQHVEHSDQLLKNWVASRT